jgi:hypothetical protein
MTTRKAVGRRPEPLAALLLAAGVLLAGGARAEVPYPACAPPRCDPACARADASCVGPDDYAEYLFLDPGQLPDDYVFDPANPTRGDEWLYQGLVDSGPAAGQVIGNDVVGAWRISTGRPDVVGAVLDSGINWNRRDLARTAALRTGELPLPPGCHPSFDCNGDAVVNVDDFAGAPCGPGGAESVSDRNGNGYLDPQDLIVACSDGVDDDGNGYVDDICGWDFQEGDNDPFDDVDYGHGTGEAGDQYHEANNGGSQAGVAPSSRHLPLKVADSFVGVDADFARAVVYAVDWGVDQISEALGTINATPSGQAAVDYARRRGVPVIASAADEQSIHHNYPANYEHTLWVNSVRPADGDLIAHESPPEFTLQNGCTNHGGRAWVAIGSNACSSEATSRGAGLSSLLIAHGKNLIDRGLLDPYPGLDAPFSAEEVRQIFRAFARDIDHTADPELTFTADANVLANSLVVTARHFPTQAGWDQFTGYGRADGRAMLSVTAQTIPPEVDLSGGLRWFQSVDPVTRPAVPVVATARTVRAPGAFEWTLEIGCGVQPTGFRSLAAGSSAQPLEAATLHTWSPAATAAACGFDPAAPVEEPDAHTVTLRLRVVDARGNLGEDRRTVSVHHDPSLAYRRFLGASGEASPTLADVDGDGVLDLVQATAAGEVAVLAGASGEPLPGFPVFTDAMPVGPSPAYDSGEVPVPREGILAAPAVEDLDRDGRVEIVAATLEGSVYVFDHRGRRRPGFPVHTEPALSAPALRDRFNDLDPGISSAPTLADLDPPGAHPDLEILVGAWDGHLYAWRADATARPGFPLKVADRALVDVDPATGRVIPRDGRARERLAKIVGSPALGDLDADGDLEILVATNEEYAGHAHLFGFNSSILNALLGVGFLPADLAGRLHAFHHDGAPLVEIGGQATAWPAPVPLLVEQLLPSVATGTPGSPALARVGGALRVAIFAAVGPPMLLDAFGRPALGLVGGAPRPFAVDFPGGGFPRVPATTGSGDAPWFGGLGSGAFGDLTGDGAPEYAAPAAGIRVLIDTLTPGSLEFSDHLIVAWASGGAVLPAFPRVMDDLQFLGSPALADVSGDGLADVVNGSGAYLVRAYRSDGQTPAGFPKLTHGWVLASPAVGDLDGDGLSELVASTREGELFVWHTPGRSEDDAIPWQGLGRDRRHTQNLDSGVSTASTPERVAGDLDADGDVDEADRDRLLGAFGRGAGHPAFLPGADYDEDGAVTFVDYQSWLAHRRAFQAAQGSCGLLGAEALLVLAVLRVRARAARREEPRCEA